MDRTEQVYDGPTLEQALRHLLNGYSAENESDTPDSILACYLLQRLGAYNAAVVAREHWYGRRVGDGAAIMQPNGVRRAMAKPPELTTLDGIMSDIRRKS